MKLSQLAGMNRNPLIVTERYEEFVRSEHPYSDKALEFMLAEMRKPDRDRSGHFSASALGGCKRQQQFTYAGLVKLPESAKRMAVLKNGDMVHLRLQMVGISEGFLPQAEVKLPDNDTGLRGTMDGVLYEESVFEAKSINDRAMRFLMHEDAPKEDHRFQVGTYMLVTGRTRAVIFYENKNTQEVKEYVVEMDDELASQVMRAAIELNDLTHDGKLAPMLEPCTQKKGWRYDYCAYRDRCPLIKTLAGAQKQATKEREAA